MKLTKLEKRLIIDLFKSNEGLFIFTLYQRYNLSPKELFLAIKSLTELGLIQSINERLTITKDGIDHAVISNIKAKDNVNEPKKIQNNFLGPKININQFYIPKMKNVTNQLLDLQ